MSGEIKTGKHEEEVNKEIQRVVSLLRQPNEAVEAITCGDLHLSHEPPLIRRQEPDWYTVMRRSISILHLLRQVFPSASIIYTGDIFDCGWKENKVPPELINFAIENLPNGYGIPGQHDLPHHRLEDLKKSAFWTLYEAGVMAYLSPREPTYTRNLYIQGFPWGTSLDKYTAKFWKYAKQPIKLAVLHAYCWTEMCSYPEAARDDSAANWGEKLEGFTAAVFGDNHKAFTTTANNVAICNNGKFMIRKADEVHTPPSIGLLTSKKRWIQFFIPQIGNSFCLDHLTDKVEAGDEIDAQKFLDGLKELGDKTFDFIEAIKRVYGQQPKEIRDVIIRALRRSGGH